MESSQGGRVPNRGRDRASIALAVIGSLLSVAAVLLLYARAEIIDEDAFADNAVEALDGRPGSRGRRRADRRQPDRARVGGPDCRQATGREVVAPSSTWRRSARCSARRPYRRTGCCSSSERKTSPSTSPMGSQIVRFALNSSARDRATRSQGSRPGAGQAEGARFRAETLVVADRVRLLAWSRPILAALGAGRRRSLLARDRRVGVLRAAVAVAGAGALVAMPLT